MHWMVNMDKLESLKKLTGESDDELLSLLLDMAKNKILEMTNRSNLPVRLESTQIELAVIMYNRRGDECSSSRSEGDVSVSYVDIPENIRKVINKNRLFKVGGRTYEVTESKEENI